MGYSGAGLYDDDAGADVRNRFRELVADGLAPHAATDTLLEEWGGALDDHDESCAFWLALADTEWRVGRLEDRVRARAMRIIASGEDLARFEHDARLLKHRRKVLIGLTDRLATPQRAPVRIRRPFRSQSPVAVGDVFSFALPAGRLVYLRAVDLTGDERDNAPTVEVLDWTGPGTPADPASLRGRPSQRRWPDLLHLIRYPKDPDPAERIVVLASGTQVTRRRMLPAVMVPWTDLEEALARNFGI
jgi:hypothetical protein